MKSVFASLVLLAAAGIAAHAQDRIFDDALPAACVQSADAQAAQWRAQGLATAELDKRYQMLLAVCSGDSPFVAAFVGRANFDYSRFGRMFVSNQMSPNLYVAMLKDRKRKLYLARHNPQWVADFVRGDADGDMVPDSMDRCAGTADLTPTGDDGCPLRTPLPPAPSSTQMRDSFNAIGMVTGNKCDGAPLPTTSAPIMAGIDTPHIVPAPLGPNDSVAVAVTKVENQPAGCPVLYELEIRLSDPNVAGIPNEQMFNYVFREQDNGDFFPQAGRLVFRLLYGEYPQVLGSWTSYNVSHVRVRAINGNGVGGGWGSTLQTTKRWLFVYANLQ